MVKLQVITSTTRPGRRGISVAQTVVAEANKFPGLEAELVDIAEYDLPLLDEPNSASGGIYTKAHSKRWSQKIAEADAYIFVTAEYNHSYPAPLKNAIDYLYTEWNDKVAGFVSYGGSANGQRAIEHLRLVMVELKIANVLQQVSFNTRADFDDRTLNPPDERRQEQLRAQFSQLVEWGEALKQVRQTAKN